MTAKRAEMLPPDAVQTGSVVTSTVTVVVPARVSATAMPPVVYPLTLVCSFETPAYVVVAAPMFDVDRKSAHLNESESKSNVPLSIRVRDTSVKVQLPAATVCLLRDCHPRHAITADGRVEVEPICVVHIECRGCPGGDRQPLSGGERCHDGRSANNDDSGVVRLGGDRDGLTCLSTHLHPSAGSRDHLTPVSDRTKSIRMSRQPDVHRRQEADVRSE